MKTRRCFVISPIGAEGSPVREHADDVFEYIIEPALDERGIEAVRSDHLLEPGRISEQMFKEILGDDLCVAVITGQNPNVFYELAVAQSAGRPVIVLLEKGETLPFDIQDLRCVMYDLKPKPLFEKVYVREIVGHIDGLERSGWQVASPFPSMGGEGFTGGPAYLDHAAKHVPPEKWLGFLEEATEVFDLVGVSLHSWKRTDDVARLFREKAAGGCRARIMLMHPENPVLPHLFVEGVADRNADEVLRAIEQSRAFFTQVAGSTDGVELRWIARGAPYGQLTRSDENLLFLPYLNSEPTAYSPVWRARAGSSLYQTMAQELEALWRTSEPSVGPG